ncbi:amino acid permease [Ureibacillus sinduriensis]|uniref:Transporter n=1 Tax=Ureibacillus sinduriensis BLB-1 = JCM 15800 TaxID=1384057 RepID=A0A0A3I2Q1_9BACL|nr:amino acid permease [Ureibacillus sinduriensis]KGR79106.1 transporter [Ureibacillus sinduriensis BLB-1 = JCM 15800]
MEIPARAGGKNGKNSEGKLKWWQLSLIGVGCTIGTGYFLGSGIGISKTGPSIIIPFILAGITAMIVSEQLGKMFIQDPQKGSFRSYTKKAYGRWAGFSSGWVYWFSEMLISGSQLTALSILTRFWFPNIPIWILASIYAVLGIIVVLIGTKGFEKTENLFAVMKVAAIFMFIILAILVLFGFFGGSADDFNVPNTADEFFAEGIIGLWSSLIFGFYAFGGIEIMGILSVRLQQKKEVIKSTTVMLIILTSIYLISIILASGFVAYDQFNAEESPFVISLAEYNLAFFPYVFNAGVVIAGFSTMAASLFAVTSMLVTMAEEGDAPKVFSKKSKLKVPPFALALTIAVLVVSIIISRIVPDRVYEYITTAAGLMLIYNWFFILISFPRLIKATKFDHVKRFIAMVLILLAVSGTFVDKTNRMGFFVSVVFIIAVIIVILFLRKRKNRNSNEYPRGI